MNLNDVYLWVNYDLPGPELQVWQDRQAAHHGRRWAMRRIGPD